MGAVGASLTVSGDGDREGGPARRVDVEVVLMRIVIMGNSGAGKSTLATRLAAEHALAHLDLDTLAWLPVTPPARAPLADSLAKLAAFCSNHDRWVIEGCYADLIGPAAERSTLLVFLNPGVEACLAHCRARPWEPHKYASQAAQDANLELLLDWVRAYETRSDEFSLRAHRTVFDSFAGAKREFTTSRVDV
ncbi:MAG: shikimate kinase [Kofleriaceae bacterium]